MQHYHRTMFSSSLYQTNTCQGLQSRWHTINLLTDVERHIVQPGMFASCRIFPDPPWQNKSLLDKFHYLRPGEDCEGYAFGSVRTKLKN